MRATASSGSRRRPGGVGELEELDEVGNAAGAFCSADHAEVRLEAVEVREEDDAGFVGVGGGLEDVA